MTEEQMTDPINRPTGEMEDLVEEFANRAFQVEPIDYRGHKVALVPTVRRRVDQWTAVVVRWVAEVDGRADCIAFAEYADAVRHAIEIVDEFEEIGIEPPDIDDDGSALPVYEWHRESDYYVDPDDPRGNRAA